MEGNIQAPPGFIGSTLLQGNYRFTHRDRDREKAGRELCRSDVLNFADSLIQTVEPREDAGPCELVLGPPLILGLRSWGWEFPCGLLE